MGSSVKLSVWAEFMEPAEIEKATPFLSKYQVSIAMAFSEKNMTREYINLFWKMNELGIDFYLWLLLPDEDGYWVNERKTEKFDFFVKRVIVWAFKHDFYIPGIAVDMEPPLQQMKILSDRKFFEKVKTMLGNLNKNRFQQAQYDLQNTADYLREHDIKTVAPIAFNVAHEMISGKTTIQDLMETPIVKWDKISPMFYTTLFPLFTKNFISREDARWYLYRAGKKFAEKMGKRASVSLGTIGQGKLDTEETTGYTSPEEFLPDIQASLAAGIEDIFIFNLKGLMSSPNEWFSTICSASPMIPKKTLKGDILYYVFSLLGKI